MRGFLNASAIKALIVLFVISDLGLNKIDLICGHLLIFD